MSNFWFNNTPTTRFIEISQENFKLFLQKYIECNRCKKKVPRPDGIWVAKCDDCGTLISFFYPTPIQQVAGKCEGNIIINVGGYGSGKTSISSNIFANMMRAIPGARMICIAQTLQQLKKSGISELKKFFHPSEIKSKTADEWILTNGGTIEFWPSDDPEKLKSANANFIWIIEGSSPKMQLMYNEALARIRNDKGYVYEYEADGSIKQTLNKNNQWKPVIKQVKNLLMVEANPEDGAWTNYTAMNSHTVIHTSSVRGLDIIKQQSKPIRHYDIISQTERNVDITTILNATYDNPLLDASYMTNLRAKCNSEEEYNRIVYCDITSKSGLVFKNVIANPNDYFVDVQEVPYADNIKFVEGLDPGGSNSVNDPDAYLLFTYDTHFKKLTLIDGFKTSGLTLDECVKKIFQVRRRWGFDKRRSYCFVADNALGKSYKYDNRFSLHTDYELRLATKILLQNDKAIDAGIKKLNAWFDNKAIKISNNFEEVRNELFNYRKVKVAKTIKGTQAVAYKESYSEYNNHIIDAMRYVVVALETYFGQRQDQPYLDYERQMEKQPSEYSLEDKFSIKQFIPEQFGGVRRPPPPRTPNKFKFS